VVKCIFWVYEVFMFGFPKTLSGIDIGAKVLRAVRVRAGRRAALEGYAERPLPEGALVLSYTKENIADMERFREAIRLSLKSAGVVRGDISASIPDQVVKVSFVELKEIPAKGEEILKFIKWKTKKSLPYDPEEAKIDYQLLAGKVMAVSVKEGIVSGYEETLLSMSLRPRFVSTPSLNLFNLFAARFGDLKDFAFISALEDSFAVIIVRGGFIDFHRSKDVGFTDDRLVNEVNSSILFYASENPDASLRRVFLYAGVRGSEALASNLSESIGMEVETLRISDVLDGPKGLDMEPYGTAVAAALCRM
jgi:Tfp pilus assembly PilM family ATPase